jgi:hypothetical protein
MRFCLGRQMAFKGNVNSSQSTKKLLYTSLHIIGIPPKIISPPSSQKSSLKICNEICSATFKTDVRLFLYCNQNDLFLNTSKCKIFSFTRKWSPIITDYNINGQILECVESIDDLGVTFDNELKFNTHIENISRKTYKMLGFLIRTCKDFKNIKTHVFLYESLVKSQLNYCTVALHCCVESKVHKICRPH